MHLIVMEVKFHERRKKITMECRKRRKAAIQRGGPLCILVLSNRTLFIASAFLVFILNDI